jgi:DNA-binding CsgD family transcriptional regulator
VAALNAGYLWYNDTTNRPDQWTFMNYTEHPCVKMYQKVQELCVPLVERFNITGFCYDMSFSGAELSMLTDNLNLFEAYYRREFNPVCSNSSGRALAPGLYTTSMLFNKNEDKRSFSYLRSLYQTPFGVHLIERVNGYDEMVSFGVNMPAESFEYFVLNHQVHLKNFARYFRESLIGTIGQLTNKENRLYFPDLLTGTEQSTPLKTVHQNNGLCIILDNGQSVSLTPQQSACLKLLIQGNTMKQIAVALYLSIRTVEHYLTAARNRLHCTNLLTLVSRYGNQIESI